MVYNLTKLEEITVVASEANWAWPAAMRDIVIDKPVDMSILQEQLNRLFVKRYNSDIFR